MRRKRLMELLQEYDQAMDRVVDIVETAQGKVIRELARCVRRILPDAEVYVDDTGEVGLLPGDDFFVVEWHDDPDPGEPAFIDDWDVEHVVLRLYCPADKAKVIAARIKEVCGV